MGDNEAQRGPVSPRKRGRNDAQRSLPAPMGERLRINVVVPAPVGERLRVNVVNVRSWA